MEKQSNSGNSQNEKLSAEIQKKYSKLTPAEASLYPSKSNEFFAAVKAKHSIERSEAEKAVKSLEATCCNTSSGPTAKVANA